MESRERLVYKAKLAEQAERYKEMKQYMSDVAKDKTNKDLSTEERNLLSVAFKNVIGSRRASWRVIQSIADSETDDSRTKILDEYRTVIETEIETICEEILQIIDGLVANSEETEPKVFYLKMKGDYLRYLAEFQTGPKKENSSSQANDAYAQADQFATNDSKGLPPTDPIRLGLALNYSVFHYEIQNDPEKACQLAKKAFDDAIAELGTCVFFWVRSCVQDFPDKPNFLFFLSFFFLFRAIGRHLVRRILQRFHPYHAIVERQFDSLDIQRRRSRRHQRGRPLNVPVVNNTQHKRNEYFDLFKTERTAVLLLAFIQLYHSIFYNMEECIFFFIFFYFI